MYQRQRQALNVGPLIENLYHKYACDILRYVHRYIFSKEDADGFISRGLPGCYREVPTLLKLGEEEQFAWLQRVARDKIIDYQRKLTKYPAITLEDMLDSPFIADHLTPEKTIVKWEEVELLRTHLIRITRVTTAGVPYSRFEDGLRYQRDCIKAP